MGIQLAAYALLMQWRIQITCSLHVVGCNAEVAGNEFAEPRNRRDAHRTQA